MSTGSPESHLLRSRSHALRSQNFFFRPRWEPVRRLRHHCHCAYMYMPMSKTTNHDNHEKVKSWVSFSFHYACTRILLLKLWATRAPLKGISQGATNHYKIVSTECCTVHVCYMHTCITEVCLLFFYYYIFYMYM